MISIFHFILVWLLGSGMSGVGSWSDAFSSVVKEERSTIYVVDFRGKLQRASDDKDLLIRYCRKYYICGHLQERNETTEKINHIKQARKWIEKI